MNELDYYMVQSINVDAFLDGTDVKLCVTNSGDKKLVTVCASSNGDDNENKFKYLTNGANYKLNFKILIHLLIY